MPSVRTRFVTLDEVDDVVRNVVVASPWDVGKRLVDDCRHDAHVLLTAITLGQEFLEYGLWQDYGTGKEVARSNSGDIGRDKVRQRRRWFSRKFYASFMNLKEFMADSIGREFIGMVSDALDADKMRRNSHYYQTH